MNYSSDKLSTSYWCLVLLRIILVCIPQLGYIHPDEYFQSVEVLTGKFFDVEAKTPWEFNATFPLRSMTVPYFTLGMNLKLLQGLNNLVTEYFSVSLKTPYFVLVFPRLFMCFLSFIVDYCIYKICVNNNEKYKSKLVILATSYVMIVFGTRTFSNTIELILFAILLYFVAESVTFSNIVIKKREYLNYRYEKTKNVVERAKFHKLRLFLRSDLLRNCFQISTVTVIGFFNRPTFLAFAVIPVFFWLNRGIGSKTVASISLHYRILIFALSSLPMIIFIIIIDSFYYGYMTWGEIGMLDISINNFVFTPLNFLKYNLNKENLAQHGLHPRYLHVLINIPLLFNVLTGCVMVQTVQYIYKAYNKKFQFLPTIRSIKGMMYLSLLTPVLALSVFPHQEPRFLIPVVVPLVYLHSQTILPEPDKILIRGPSSVIKNVNPDKKKPSLLLFKLRLFLNTIFVIFYGFIHQGGIYNVITDLEKDIRLSSSVTNFHIVTSNIYMLPESLLFQSSENKLRTAGKTKFVTPKRVHFYEEGSNDLHATLRIIKKIFLDNRIVKEVKPYKFYKYYLIIPSSLDDELFYAAAVEGMNIKQIKTFYPHLSTEALPNLHHYCLDVFSEINCNGGKTLSLYEYIVKLLTSCGLNIVEFSL